MLLDNLSISELFLLILIILTVILFLIFKWFFKQVREICRRIAGYIIFGQLIFILLSWGIFLIIFFYYLINPENVNVLNIFLTVIVGFLGTILGVFFSEKAFEKIVKDLEERYETLRNKKIKTYNKVIRILNQLK
jgi:hypothetical protein|tara:strand:- start:3391 stop:3795 length:405 start_codon:yes stop_codon:yes gene_type:complete